MLLELDARGKSNWVTRVRNILCENGFGCVWAQQGVGDINLFLQTFRIRLIDCHWQNWNSHVHDSNRFDWYRDLNSLHCIPEYLSMNLDRHLKQILTKFRFGVSDILVHFHRYTHSSVYSLTCPLCQEEEENEVHFVLCCPVLTNLRTQFIPAKYFRQPSMFRLTLLMTAKSAVIVRQLAIFLYKAFKIRELVTT